MPMPVEFTKTEIPDVLEVRPGIFEDERGFFTESYSQPVWTEAGFEHAFIQDNLSLSKKGTLRGMHYQLSAHGMGKLVRVLTGSIFDVAVDLRRGSPNFGKWVGRTLSGANALSLWIPEGFAHGFVAMEDETLVLYKCTESHAPVSERAIAYNDPEVGIDWPLPPTVISAKDAIAPSFKDAEFDFVFKAS